MLEQRRRAKRSAVAQVGKLSKRTGTRQGRDELKHGARQAAQCLRRRGLQAFDERELDWTGLGGFLRHGNPDLTAKRVSTASSLGGP